MSDENETQEDTPATWENVLVGKAKKLVGRAMHDEQLLEEGSEQEEIAHDVREDHDEHVDPDTDPRLNPDADH